MTQLYALRLKPGTYAPPFAAGMYVAQSALASELRFTPDIQTARTWTSYQETYKYLDDNLYGSAEVVPVVPVKSLLPDFKKLGNNHASAGITQRGSNKVDKKLTTEHTDSAPAVTANQTHDDSSLPEPDDTLHLYRLYRKSESSFVGEPLAEEWATDAEVSEVNEEAIQRGLIWVKSVG